MSNWIRHTIRVRRELIPVITFLWHKSALENISTKAANNIIIIEALNYIEANNPKIKIKRYHNKRIAKTYPMTDDTQTRFFDMQNSLGIKISEMFEVCIYIYALLTLTEDEFIYLNLHTWGISLEEHL